MERRTFLKATAAGLLVGASPLGPVFAQGKKIRLGFSQSTTLEPWRVQFNKDMKKEADQHPEVELLIADGQDKTEKQVADVENFIRQGVDVLLISPKESAGLTGVTLKAIEAGIPVIVLDRNVDTDKFTQFIGGDNVVIGRAVGDNWDRWHQRLAFLDYLVVAAAIAGVAYLVIRARRDTPAAPEPSPEGKSTAEA